METFTGISCFGCLKQGIIEMDRTLAIVFRCQFQCRQRMCCKMACDIIIILKSVS